MICQAGALPLMAAAASFRAIGPANTRFLKRLFAFANTPFFFYICAQKIARRIGAADSRRAQGVSAQPITRAHAIMTKFCLAKIYNYA